MNPKLFVSLTFIISWISIRFISKEQVKKYTPVSIFASLIVSLIFVIVTDLGWWKLKKPVIPGLKSINVFYVFGPFFVGTIWIFKLVYKIGFVPYLITNALIDSFFTYIIVPFAEKIGVGKSYMSKTFILGLMLSTSLIIYGFQKWYEAPSNKKTPVS
ncbi:hypothetical protein [Priestia megaterium]|uniref:hypothetical protein n=1 Tax=Priestia megaterium TaxID=1404 RepID=UPI000BED0232|nr:hypothetical protein [Priestia megaterium]MDH6651497.1 hypothetical protein [Bacillus sp. PvP124]MDP9579421.1 hypothetical protein [Bacillus sp. 1751]PEE41520.1 hypothetical protein COM71_31085 [Priestia megaterium]PFP06754.1 hypothetical protein COJ90_27335 [Priestia megaterium]PGO61007.1 hypothetical protein CN981_07945 [Priestia megaterium]